MRFIEAPPARRLVNRCLLGELTVIILHSEVASQAQRRSHAIRADVEEQVGSNGR